MGCGYRGPSARELAAHREGKSKRFKRIKHCGQCFTGQARLRWHSLCDGTPGGGEIDASWRVGGPGLVPGARPAYRRRFGREIDAWGRSWTSG